VRRVLLRLHRWISLGFGLLWLVQAGTGLVMVFHWELEDAQVPGAHRATDLDALQARLAALAPPGSGRRIVSVWTTAGAPDRYDITVASGDHRDAVRVDGAGDVLRTKDKAQAGLIDDLVLLHQSLLAGEAGRWLIGISGLVLLSNIGLGLKMAWPRRGAWGPTLLPSPAPKPVPRLFAWHRAAGLWLAAPAIVLVCAGALLAYDDELRALLHGEPAELAPRAPTGPPIPFAEAVRTAEAAFPGSRLTAVRLPTAGDATYRIRVLAPGERRRAYGLSTVFVDANTGAVRATLRAAAEPFGRKLMDGLYAIHTGEMAGAAGRLADLVVAAWLLIMIGLGGALWLTRRTRQTRKAPGPASAAQRSALQEG
jgi:uncharacterized iron-regulated membrane protein